MKNTSKIMWGLVLIIIGLILSINALGIAHVDIFFDGWWTLFIIVPSIIELVSGKEKYSSLVWLIIGVALLLGAQGFISFHLLFKLLIPFMIVVIGLSVLYKGVYGEKIKVKVQIQKSDELEEIAVVMSDENKSIKGAFKGAVVDTVFGHCTLDLSEAKIADNASLKISSVFAKVDVILPNDVTVKMNSTRVFGSISTVQKDHTDSKAKKEKTLYIESEAVFGGISLR